MSSRASVSGSSLCSRMEAAAALGCPPAPNLVDRWLVAVEVAAAVVDGAGTTPQRIRREGRLALGNIISSNNSKQQQRQQQGSSNETSRHVNKRSDRAANKPPAAPAHFLNKALKSTDSIRAHTRPMSARRSFARPGLLGCISPTSSTPTSDMSRRFCATVGSTAFKTKAGAQGKI